jgi:hypothetical protein
LYQRGKLPAEIGGVVEAGAQPKSASRREQMHRIAGERDAAIDEPVSHQRRAGVPGLVADDLDRDIGADRKLHPALDVGRIHLALIARLGQHHEFVGAVE